MVRLGLIGDNISRSQSPRLHRLAGDLCGLDVSYDPLVPAALGTDFDAVFERCRTGGFRGINVTYPYKETVVARLSIDDPLARALGACNTVIFDADAPRGFNTDCTGFAAAFRRAFGDRKPGHVAMAGAGGVGKAIAFALGHLEARSLRVFDPDRAKVEALAASLALAFPGMDVKVCDRLADAVAGADGLVNSTPLGMVGKPGNAFAGLSIAHCRWAFDAVYTPVDTQFLQTAGDAGLAILSGYELFFYQGIHAFKLFTGRDVDETRLRAALLEPEDARRAAS